MLPCLRAQQPPTTGQKLFFPVRLFCHFPPTTPPHKLFSSQSLQQKKCRPLQRQKWRDCKYLVVLNWLIEPQLMQSSRPVLVEKPIPLEFDMGNLCAFDSNPLDPALYAEDREKCLQEAARDGAQALINQLLTQIPLKSTPDGVYAELPAPVTPLPREKPLPKPKDPTKWYPFSPPFHHCTIVNMLGIGSYLRQRRGSKTSRRTVSSSTTKRRVSGLPDGATRARTRTARGTGSSRWTRRSRKRGPRM